MKYVTSIVRESTMLDNLQSPSDFIASICKHAVQEMQHLATEDATKKFSSKYSSYKNKGGGKGGGNKRKLDALVADAVKKATVNFVKKGGGKSGAKGGGKNSVTNGKGGKGKGGKSEWKAPADREICKYCFSYHSGGPANCYHHSFHSSFKGTIPDYIR